MIKMQEQAKRQSVNSLGNLSPEDMTAWLGVSERETKKFLDMLHEQRILRYKFIFQCDCGERCTVYEKRLKRDGVSCCEICGREYTAAQILEKMSIRYEIDRDALLNMEENKVDFRAVLETQATEKVVPIARRKEEKSMEIFIGSSTEAAEYMEKIAVTLENLKVKPLLWNASGEGIFVAGESTIDSLISITRRVDAAIFIFNADDKTWNEKSALASALDSADAVRDNVLFEYGLFMGKLGKSKVCFICKGKPKIASDLKGITYIDGDAGDYTVKDKLKDWIRGMDS